MTQTAYQPTRPGSLQAVRAEKAVDQRLADELEVADVVAQMGTKEGRRFVWRLMDRAGIYREGNGPQPNAMAGEHQRGRHFVVDVLDDQLRRHCNDQWLLMVSENDPRSPRKER